MMMPTPGMVCILAGMSLGKRKRGSGDRAADTSVNAWCTEGTPGNLTVTTSGENAGAKTRKVAEKNASVVACSEGELAVSSRGWSSWTGVAPTGSGTTPSIAPPFRAPPLEVSESAATYASVVASLTAAWKGWGTNWAIKS